VFTCILFFATIQVVFILAFKDRLFYIAVLCPLCLAYSVTCLATRNTTVLYFQRACYRTPLSPEGPSILHSAQKSVWALYSAFNFCCIVQPWKTVSYCLLWSVSSS